MKELKDIAKETHESWLVGRYDITKPSHRKLQDSFYDWYFNAKKKFNVSDDVMIEMLGCMEMEISTGQIG